jgi:hypothetical protein
MPDCARGELSDSSGSQSNRMCIAYFDTVSGSMPGTLVVATPFPNRRFISANGVASTCPERSGFPVESSRHRCVEIRLSIARSGHSRSRVVNPLRVGEAFTEQEQHGPKSS